MAARGRQQQRAGKPNGELKEAELGESFRGGDDCFDLLEQAAKQMNLSARAYRRVQRVALTIADLADDECIRPQYVAEALALWQVDRGRRQLPASPTM
jgi:magnesium chelatase family protein